MKKLSSIILLFCLAAITSCKKDFLNLEVNPNQPSIASPQFILSGALITTANLFNANTSSTIIPTGGISLSTGGYVATTGIWVGYWTPSGNYVPNSRLNTNNFINTDYQIFLTYYNNLSNYDNLDKIATVETSLAHFSSIAKIMKAYVFEEIVDTYNNVPYSQAFKAPEVLSPAYDKGEAIYDDLLKQLDAAMTAIKSPPADAINPSTSDAVFKGDMMKWLKFANTIKLRLAIRQWNKLTGKQSALKAAIAATAGNGYIDNTFQAAVNPGYTNDDANGQKQSPFYVSYAFNATGAVSLPGDYYKANAYAINKLTATNDPRLSRLYAPIPGGTTFFGNIYGSTAPKNNAGTSSIGPGLLKSAGQDAVLFSSSESLFLQSEAALYSLISGDPKEFYEKGITSSFTSLTVPSPEASAKTYYQQDMISYQAASNKLQAIITQKWIALNGYGNMEAYNEYRRTGFPADIPVSTQSSQPAIPSRIFYPQSEYQQNGPNVSAEGTINQFTSKIFWAK